MSVFQKRCKVCGKTYSLTQFLALDPPANGVARMHGLHWRNCECGGTLVILEAEVPTISNVTQERA